MDPPLDEEAAPHSEPTLNSPNKQVSTVETLLASKCRRVYANAHTYHINSVSINSDQETFISADDLRVNLWHLDITDQSFNIVDIKPPHMEDLTEVRGGCCVYVCARVQGLICQGKGRRWRRWVLCGAVAT